MHGLRIDSFPNAALAGPEPGPHGMPLRAVTSASPDPRILLAVHEPGVNLVIWTRDPPVTLIGSVLDDLVRAAPFTAISTTTPTDLSERLSEQIPVSLPDELLSDIADLAAVFAMIDGDRQHVRVRLEALVHDGCTKWHADAIGLRMLCTYHGAGTQWLPIEGGAAGARTIGKGVASRSFVQIAAGSVAILKGESHPNNAGNGCIHRSPPAEPGKRTRLLLCIDQTQWNLEE